MAPIGHGRAVTPRGLVARLIEDALREALGQRAAIVRLGLGPTGPGITEPSAT